MSQNGKSIEGERIVREDQFWFTTAVVTFNTVVLGLDSKHFPCWFLVVASLLVSLFGVHLILTRWLWLRVEHRKAKLNSLVENAKEEEKRQREKEKEEFKETLGLDALANQIPDPTASISKRVRAREAYTWRETALAWKSFREVVAEWSGSWFFIMLIFLTCLGVVFRLCDVGGATNQTGIEPMHVDAEGNHDLAIRFLPLLFTLVGGLIGFVSSFTIWWLGQRRQRRERRLQTLLRLIQLAFETQDFTRKLAYAKLEGIQAVRQIGHNPMSEIMAITELQCDEVGPVVQQLHHKLEDLFGMPVDEDTRPQIPPFCEEIVTLVNTFNRRVLEIASRERLDEGSNRTRNKGDVGKTQQNGK